MKKFDKKGISTVGTLAIVLIIIVVIVASASYYYLTRPSSMTSLASSTTSSSTSLTGSVPSTASTSTSSGLILFSADAYTNESTALASAYTSSGGVPVPTPTAAGSTTLGQEIANGQPVSVFISVSHTAVENVTLSKYYPGWAVAFATDQMALVYSNATMSNPAGMTVINDYNSAVTANTTQAWYDFFQNLTSGAVKVGISNPNQDPAGYRGWMVLQLAGVEYDNNNTTYFPDQMLSNTGNITGASAADLVAPLEAGSIQFLFIYKSAGIADGLNVMALPPQINLGNPTYSSVYALASYALTMGVETGGVITLWITVPTDAVNPTDADNFVVYVVDHASTVLSTSGLTFYSPGHLYNDTDTAVPSAISSLLSSGQLVEKGALS